MRLIRWLAFPSQPRRLPWSSVVVGGGVVAAMAISWWTLLFYPLGAAHDGRINARFGLVVRNYLEKGLVGSEFLASMSPFAEQVYVHHPPLINIGQVLVGEVFGQGEWQLHLIGYAAGLITLAGLLWLSGELGCRPGATVISLALVAATPMFWIYARLGLGISLIVILAILWVRYQERTRALSDGVDGSALPVGLVAMSGLVAFSSWIGALVVAVIAGWAMRKPHLRRVATACAISAGVMVGVTLVWAFVVGDPAALIAHAEFRRQWPVWGDLADTYRWFYRTLFPTWFQWLIPPALVVSLLDRRTRLVSMAIIVALGLWTLANPNAAYVHDYWTYPLLAPIFLGLAATLDRVASYGDRAGPGLGAKVLVVGSVAGLAMLASFLLGGLDPYRDAYFDAPADAGHLSRDFGAPPDQEVAWVLEGVDPLPRWLSYYWDLPAETVRANAVGPVTGRDLVMVRLDRVPDDHEWDLVAERGRYALVRAGR